MIEDGLVESTGGLDEATDGEEAPVQESICTLMMEYGTRPWHIGQSTNAGDLRGCV